VPYEVVVGRSAEKELRGLTQEWRRRIAARLSTLAEDQHPNQSTRLQGSEHFRLRVGDYRVIYSVDDSIEVVTILAIGHRREVYRDL